MKKLGFTLAEVLITLVIIGVIAAMTVPTLMNNTQGQENKTAFKKAISSMNQALTMEYALEGNTAASLDLADIMKKRTNVITKTTWPGSSDEAFATADGIIYKIPATSGDTKTCPGEPGSDDEAAKFDIYEVDACAVGWVDVNGQKGPNKQVTNSDKPEDQFLFKIYETKVVPGTGSDTVEAAVMYDQKGITKQSSAGQEG